MHLAIVQEYEPCHRAGVSKAQDRLIRYRTPGRHQALCADLHLGLAGKRHECGADDVLAPDRPSDAGPTPESRLSLDIPPPINS